MAKTTELPFKIVRTETKHGVNLALMVGDHHLASTMIQPSDDEAEVIQALLYCAATDRPTGVLA